VVADQLAAAPAGGPGAHRAWGDEIVRARATAPGPWAEARRSARAPIHPLRVCGASSPISTAARSWSPTAGEFGQWVQAGLEAETRLINGPAGPSAARSRWRSRPGSAIPPGPCSRCWATHLRLPRFELDTAARYRLPIVTVIATTLRWNGGAPAPDPALRCRSYRGCELAPSRYDQLAAALGAHGEHVERADDLEPALDRALRSGLPAIINVAIEGLAAPTLHRHQVPLTIGDDRGQVLNYDIFRLSPLSAPCEMSECKT